jgi:sensor histidine kinase regulating citrate/malate metabolism
MLNERGAYHPVRVEVLPQHVSEELQAFFANHPAAKNKRLLFSIDGSARPVKTDFSLLQRVLCNMITNALEATDENGAVEVWLNESNAALSFSVWNAKAVREDVALRIFQRNFSTKAEAGRGVGTYAMKLFGEQYLGGKVNFTTSQKDGTVFTFTLPC